MKVTITKPGKAKDIEGFEYDINVLIIDRKCVDIEYDKSTSFFKAACPTGTKHTAKQIGNRKINLY